MKFLKGKFLIAALALSVAGAGLCGQGVNAYKASRNVSEKKALFFYDARYYDEGMVFIGFDLTGTPYRVEDSEENKIILAKSIRVELDTSVLNLGSDPNVGNYTFNDFGGLAIESSNIIVSPDGKKISFGINYPVQGYQDLSALAKIEDLELAGSLGTYAFSVREGYDFSGLKLLLDDGVSLADLRADHIGKFVSQDDSGRLWAGIPFNVQKSFKREDEFIIKGLSVDPKDLVVMVGDSVIPSSFFSGLDDKYSFTWKTPVDTSSPGKKEGVVTVEYRGEVTTVVDIPVVVNVKAAPEVKNVVIDDASVPQAPNTGFQNTAGAGLIVLSLLGFSTWFVVKRK